MSAHEDSHPIPLSNSHLLNADPRIVDRILATELNSLSFDDREAISEELHGVRSMAPIETPEMVKNALLELYREINARLLADLSSSHKMGKSKYKEQRGKSVSRQEYLSDLIIASDRTLSVPSNSSGQLPPLISNSCNQTTLVTGYSNSISNLKQTRYSYALSSGFCMKFLRAELFDVKKAAARYISCIHFLVDYFGTVALERPLYLEDLDKNEQKLLREGHLQLMPSRDRLGRRIIVFLGGFGHKNTHRNRFRICMYMIFQVASEDETTQRNGLVALYSRHDDFIHGFFQLAKFQAECMRYFDAVPLRYSAFHCFLPDDIDVIRGLFMHSFGKRIRIITRIHKVSSITETFYKLRCFGIPTEDFPVTNTGSVKTKNLTKWIKFRTALESAYQRGDRLSSCYTEYQHPSQELGSSPDPSSVFLGIECPQHDSVIFRNGGSAWEHPGNIKFRRILAEREPEREKQKTIVEKSGFLESIISDVFASGLTFLVYDDRNNWYVELRDYAVLRKKVFQALRDQSARRKRGDTAMTPAGGNNRSFRGKHQVNQSCTSLFRHLDNDVKRQKVVADWKSGWMR